MDEQKIKVAISNFNTKNYSLKKVYVISSVIDKENKAIIVKGFSNVKECKKSLL